MSQTQILKALVLDIAHNADHGLRHAEFVTKVLERGFRPRGHGFSAHLHSVIQELVVDGELTFDEVTRLARSTVVCA